MKARLFTLFSICTCIILTGISSCKKDADSTNNAYDDPACSGCEKIIASAANDSSSEGVYKGVIVSGTGVGHFRMNLKNGVDQSFIKMIFTRETYPVVNDSLKYSGNLQVLPNTTVNATFRGSVARADIHVQDNGQSYYISDFALSGSIGTGPYPQASIIKEVSTAQVKVFEGTMSGTSSSAPSGKIGFVVGGNKIEGIITNSNNSVRERFSNGVLDASGNFSFSFSGNNSVYTGRVTSATEISGSFSIQGSPAGTFTATRTL